VVSTNLKVSGVPVFSAGDFEGAGAEAIIYRDSALPAYRKLVLRDGRLIGAVLYGDTADSQWYLDLIREGRPIHDIRPYLPFGQAYAEAA
jgi:nitrite reductase (NADH) large subunit